MTTNLSSAAVACLLSVAGLGFALVLAACTGWDFISRETANRRNTNAR